MSNRIYVAIDTPDLARAQALAQKVRHHVGGLKLGLEFFCAHGATGVREMAHIGLPIFLDLKLHDIPNTVAKASVARPARPRHPDRPCQRRPRDAGGCQGRSADRTKVVAVTMLTSLDASDLSDNRRHRLSCGSCPPPGRFGRRGRRGRYRVLRRRGRRRQEGVAQGLFRRPRVRPVDGVIGDQKRVVTPRAAVDAGLRSW